MITFVKLIKKRGSNFIATIKKSSCALYVCSSNNLGALLNLNHFASENFKNHLKILTKISNKYMIINHKKLNR